MLVLHRKWKFTLVDGTGPSITKAAVIIKPDQLTNSTTPQLWEYQNTIALQYFHAQQLSKLIGQCTVSEIPYKTQPHKGSQHSRGLWRKPPFPGVCPVHTAPNSPQHSGLVFNALFQQNSSAHVSALLNKEGFRHMLKYFTELGPGYYL